jgi:hypothetical protein
MKLEFTMCHSQLVSMILLPEMLRRAVTKYEATAPDMDGEGFNGFMEVKATFYIRDLQAFNELYQKSYVFPSDRTAWYHGIKNGLDKLNQ